MTVGMSMLRQGMLSGILVSMSLGISALAFPRATYGQQAPSTAQAQDTQSGQDDESSRPQPSLDAGGTATTSLETGQSVEVRNRVLSPMRIAHLSLLSFSTFYSYDSNYTLRANDSSGSNAYAARALVMYSTGSQISGLDIQYQPYLYVYQAGQQTSATLDSRLDFHAFHQLSSRLTLNVDELFSYSPNSGSRIDPTVSANYATGDVTLRPFLGIGYKEINNQLLASLATHISAQDYLLFQADYNFASLSRSGSFLPAAPQGFQTNSTVGSGITWTHELNQARQIGLTYHYSHQILSKADSEQQYHSLLASYSQRIRPTLQLRLSAGPSIQLHGGGRKAYTVIGYANVLKTFRSSSLLFSFSRDYNFTGVPTDGYYDRYDGSYSKYFGQHWAVSVGAGYLRQSSSVAARLSGRNVWGGPEYRLNSKWSAVLQIANSVLTGGGLPRGASLYLVSAGLHWSSEPEHGLQQ